MHDRAMAVIAVVLVFIAERVLTAPLRAVVPFLLWAVWIYVIWNLYVSLWNWERTHQTTAVERGRARTSAFVVTLVSFIMIAVSLLGKGV
jgi:energy-coupling factor transporter transmembrane protein EcfT